DDRALPVFDHQPGSRAAAQERPGEVGVQHVAPLRVAHHHRVPVGRDPGVVDERVQPAVIRADLREHPAHVLRVCDVALDERGVGLVPGNRGQRLLGPLGDSAVVAQDGGTGPGEAGGDRGPDALGGTGDHGELPVEPHQVPPPPTVTGWRIAATAPRCRRSRAVSRQSPASTRPGPTSTTSPMSSATSRRTVSNHRTGSVTWAMSRSRCASMSVTNSPVTLETTGTRGAASGTSASTSASARRAGSISGEWYAPPTGIGLARRAPAAAAAARTAWTAAASPETTTCRAELMFATTTSPCLRHRSSTCARSSPTTAPIVPSRLAAAAAIAVPRNVTTASAVDQSRLPAAVSAVYSPRLCPATAT